MDGRRLSASEVVRDAEASLARSAALRAEARRMLEEADAIDAATHRMAVEALGESHGAQALALARMSVGEADEGRADPTPAPERRHDLPPAPPAPAAQPAPAAHDQGAGSKELFHGVQIPSSRRAEAEAIAAEARGVAAQGKKLNPYAGDRGKNQWRGALFKAVLAASAAPQRSVTASLPTVPAAPREAARAEAPVPTSPSAVPADAHPAPPPAHDPLDDLLPGRETEASAAAVESLPADPVGGGTASDPPPERLESHPVPPTRRAGFGNPVPKPPGLTEAQSRAGARPSLLSRPGRPPNVVQR